VLISALILALHRLGSQDRGDGAEPNFAFTEFSRSSAS
jgi:hypothetical protein